MIFYSVPLILFFASNSRPMVPELNIAGEIVTMIDPNADVINDATVQALLETMDGDRTVVCRTKENKLFNTFYLIKT